MKFISSMAIVFFVIVYLIIESTNATPTTPSSSSGGDDVDKLKALKNRVTTLELMLSQIYKEFTDMKADTKDKLSKHGACQLMKYAPCGDCRCVEDLTLVRKYYCDCRERPAARDCKDHYVQGQRISGLYLVNHNLGSRLTAQVFCDQNTDGGGWTVVQRRMDGSENFFRNWTEYKIGFGQLHKEHWLGNQEMYLLTSHAFFKGSELRIDMQVKGESTQRWAKYSQFNINGEYTGYTLHVSGFIGSSGVDDGLAMQNKMKFSTYDVDNDLHSSRSCSMVNKGAWWYNACHRSNLNGMYDEFQINSSYGTCKWGDFRLQFSEMKVRRI